MKNTVKCIFMIFAIGIGFASFVQASPFYGYSVDQYSAPKPVMHYRNQGRIWVEKKISNKGYELLIYTSGNYVPEAIQVSVVGRTVLIETKRSQQQQEMNDRGFYNFSRSTSSFRKRLTLPRNADSHNMKRVEKNGTITILFPFINEPYNQ